MAKNNWKGAVNEIDMYRDNDNTYFSSPRNGYLIYVKRMCWSLTFG